MRVVLGLENSKQPVFDRKTRVVLVETSRKMKINYVGSMYSAAVLELGVGFNEIIYLMAVLEVSMTIWRF